MNKILKLVFIILLLIVIVNVSVYILKVVFGYRTLTITNFDIQALVKDNGDMKVDILNEYLFNGKYNGVYITIPKDINSYETSTKSINDSELSDTLYNNTGIADFKVYLTKDGVDTELRKVEYAYNGNKDVYTVEESNGYIKYKIYEPSSDESKTFKISYTLINAGVKHNDSGEIYWNFIGGNYECKIDNLNIDLKFESPSQIKYSYIHGNQTGKLTTNINNVNVKYSNITTKQFVAVRLLFDNTSIQHSNKYSLKNAIPIVLDQEKVLQDRTDKRILINNILICLTILLAIYYIYLLIKYERDKLFIVYCNDDYELLSKYNPMILACIAQNREMNPRDIIAVLLDLVNKKVLKMEIRKSSVKNKYFISKESNNIEVDEIEQSVLDLFFQDVNKIELQSSIKDLNRSDLTIEKIKAIDKLAINKLSTIGANSIKVSKPLLVFNNIIFAVVCIITILSTAFNISLANSTLSQSNLALNSSVGSSFIIIFTFIIVLLPIVLYIIYFLLYVFRYTQKYIGKIAFKFSGKKLVKSILTFAALSSGVFTLLFLTVKNEYVIINTVLFMVALLIIMTDNLMSRHNVKIYKSFLSLKMIEDKLENGSLLKDKKIDDILLWDKYLTFAIALGITNVSKYTNNLDIQDDFNDFLLQTNDFITTFYNIDSFDRDIKSDMLLDSFKNNLSSFSSSYFTSSGSSSGFGGGGFSGGGGGGGRWWWILVTIAQNNLILKYKKVSRLFLDTFYIITIY
jgi:uncharacterized membrane protein